METRDASPAHFLIKIESFSSLSKHGIHKYESREFEAGDYKWRLIIYPDGQNSKDQGDDHVSVYLATVGTSSLSVDWEVNAIFSILLYNQILDNYLCFRGKTRRFHATKSMWGFSKLISKKMLKDPSNGLLVDDTCVLGAEVFVIKSQRVIECVSMLKVSNPYKRDWKISEFSKVEEYWISELFTSGDHNWKVIVYPNGCGSEEGRSVSMFLVCVSSIRFAAHEKVKADCYMCIKNQLHDDHCTVNLSQWFTRSKRTLGVAEMMPLADTSDPAKGFIVNDCCIVEIELSVRAVVRDQPE